MQERGGPHHWPSSRTKHWEVLGPFPHPFDNIRAASEQLYRFSVVCRKVVCRVLGLEGTRYPKFPFRSRPSVSCSSELIALRNDMDASVFILPTRLRAKRGHRRPTPCRGAMGHGYTRSSASSGALIGVPQLSSLRQLAILYALFSPLLSLWYS